MAERSKVTCNLSTDCSHRRTLVRIPLEACMSRKVPTSSGGLLLGRIKLHPLIAQSQKWLVAIQIAGRRVTLVAYDWLGLSHSMRTAAPHIAQLKQVKLEMEDIVQKKSRKPDRCGFYLGFPFKFRFSIGRPNHVFRLTTRPFKIQTSIFRYSNKSGFWVSDFQRSRTLVCCKLPRILRPGIAFCLKFAASSIICVWTYVK